jgi:predicted nucleic acid-binding protein
MAATEPFVVDASITMSWCFEDESSPPADAVLSRLEHGRAVAPSVWTLEVANAIRSAQRRGRLNEAETPVLISLLLALPIDVDDNLTLDEATGRVLQLARSFDLSTYDAAYLDLALRRGLAIASVDGSLVAAAQASGVAVLGPLE